MFKYLIIFTILSIIKVFYLKIAASKRIIDTPNHRSAHANPTIRGGGIIFIPAVILFILFFPVESQNFYFLIASILLVAVISFIDDLVSLSTLKRILFHCIAFTLIFYDLNFFKYVSLISISYIFLSYIFSLGYLNIYNFMDGINGITFLNALVSYITFYIINTYIIEFTSSDLLLILIFSTLIFGFFNFRLKPVCFAGDVGSITIGFTIIYFVIKLFLVTDSYIVFLILGVYLIDGGWTISERVLRKENIFEAHRRHLYQLYANELKIPHLKISFSYFMVQLVLNALVFCVLSSIILNSFTVGSLILLVLSTIYYYIKKRVYKKINKLLNQNKQRI